MEFISEGYRFRSAAVRRPDKVLGGCRSEFSDQAPNFLIPDLRPQRRTLSTGGPAGVRSARLVEVCHE